jgi:hypothetical protein
MFRYIGFVLLAGLLAASPVSADTTEEQLARGEYLVQSAGCIN